MASHLAQRHSRKARGIPRTRESNLEASARHSARMRDLIIHGPPSLHRLTVRYAYVVAHAYQAAAAREQRTLQEQGH